MDSRIYSDSGEVPRKNPPFRLIGIVGDAESLKWALHRAADVPEIGIGLMLRDPEHKAERVRALAQTARGAMIPANVTLIANGCRVEDISWRHLSGREWHECDDDNRTICSPEAFGCSIHTLDEINRAAQLGPRYLLLSPIFPTSSKPGNSPLGLAVLREAVERTQIPIFALGGIISVERGRECLTAGAYGIAGISLFHRDHASSLRAILDLISHTL